MTKTIELLKLDYPELLGNADITCKAGWFDIILETCKKIESAANNLNLNKESQSWPQISTIKEKFGVIRIYYDSDHPELSATINKILEYSVIQSRGICEECGEPGEWRQERVMATRCKQHQDIFVVKTFEQRLKDIESRSTKIL